MRINGFDQIKAFYTLVFQQEYEFTPQHISLYVFLINQNNRNNWVEWFKCPFDLGMAGSCIGNKKTYYRCLNDLSEWNLLQYEKGTNNWKAPKIRLEVLKSTTTETATVPQSEPLPLQLDTPLDVPLGLQVDVPLPTHIYKLITSNLKLVTDNLERWIKNELKKKPEIPTKEIFMAYAKTLKPYKPELEFAIESKYDTWLDDGWQNGNGKKISNWQNALKNTITFLRPIMVDKSKPITTYGNNKH